MPNIFGARVVFFSIFFCSLTLAVQQKTQYRLIAIVSFVSVQIYLYYIGVYELLSLPPHMTFQWRYLGETKCFGIELYLYSMRRNGNILFG